MASCQSNSQHIYICSAISQNIVISYDLLRILLLFVLVGSWISTKDVPFVWPRLTWFRMVSIGCFLCLFRCFSKDLGCHLTNGTIFPPSKKKNSKNLKNHGSRCSRLLWSSVRGSSVFSCRTTAGYLLSPTTTDHSLSWLCNVQRFETVVCV